jgi:hypothetical protein
MAVKEIIMADDADIATERSEQEMALFRAQRASTRFELPDEDDAGNRYCLDCGETIPLESSGGASRALRVLHRNQGAQEPVPRYARRDHAVFGER